MKKKGRPPPYSQTLRVLRLLEWFHRRKKIGITLQDIVYRFEVTKRTASRDIKALEELHVPLIKERQNRIAIWKLYGDYKFMGYDEYDMIEFNYDEFISETADFWRIEIDGLYIWFPKSECQIDKRGETIDVPKWLARKEGLSED
jgi:hypothetical protein